MGVGEGGKVFSWKPLEADIQEGRVDQEGLDLY